MPKNRLSGVSAASASGVELWCVWGVSRRKSQKQAARSVPTDGLQAGCWLVETRWRGTSERPSRHVFQLLPLCSPCGARSLPSCS